MTPDLTPTPTAPPPAPELLIWRLDQLERRVDGIDTGGTRGVQALTLRVDELVKDMATHEAEHKASEQQRRSDRRWIIGVAVALITPLYPLIGWMLAAALRGGG